MLNNPSLLYQLPRQANVVLKITPQTGEPERFYNRLVEAHIVVREGVLIMEVRRFATADAIEPAAISTFVNPAKWEQLAQPDPTE